MAALIALRPDLDWQASGGLFDWVLEFLASRVSDRSAAERLKEIEDNNLGSLWISEFPTVVQREILTLLRNDLVPAAARDLPDSDRRDDALKSLQELADLTYEV
jgi:hypothetical protein